MTDGMGHTGPIPDATAAAKPVSMSLLPYIVAATFFMEYLDSTIIATALPAMARSFHVGPNELSLGMTAYMLTLAVFIPVSGWAADRFGSRTVFACAVTIFTIASVLCGFSTSVGTFIAARVLQGAGGAMMVPVGRFIVVRNTETSRMIQAISTITWPAVVAPVVGPTVGGMIVTFATWHWIFFINVPLGLAVLAAIFALVPEQHGPRRPMDWGGFVLGGTSLTAILLGTELASNTHASLALAGLLFAAGLVLGAATLRHAAGQDHPLLDFRLMRHPTFSVTVLAGTLSRFSIDAIPYLMPLLLQVGFGLTAFHAGTLLLAFAFGNLGMKMFTTRILATCGFRATACVNAALGVAFILLAATMVPATPLAVLLLILLGCGVTRSMQYTLLATLGYADIKDGEKGAASTLLSVNQQMCIGLGIAFGALALRVVATLRGEHPGTDAFIAADFHWAFLVVAIPLALSIPRYLRMDRTAGNALRTAS
ncbi:major facilitator superfamily transporter [Gluconacetobacter azotocaptans DSM 13594]|nr:major facilitator superfamily transporter [Gluconacetobacter azotocaptans DSM 13594]